VNSAAKLLDGLQAKHLSQRTEREPPSPTMMLHRLTQQRWAMRRRSAISHAVSVAA
jgi:hypothetical protein